MKYSRNTKHAMVLALLMLGLGSLSFGQVLPNTGQQITPLAPINAAFVPLNPGLSDNPTYLAGQAATSVVSPDGKTLLVLTSGYNLVKNSSNSVIPADSTQFVFVYDISQYQPVQKQVISVNNTYYGIVFDPSGTAFYVSGGVDDTVHIFLLGQNGMWAESASSPVALGHLAKAVPPLNLGGVGLEVKPQAAGIAISGDGSKLVVTNYYNDSISVLTQSSPGVWAVAAELDLRPGIINPSFKGFPGGEYPFWVVIKGSNTAYVSSIRDREIDVVDITSPAAPALTTRISVPGEPNKMVLNASQSMLFVAQDVSDSVGVIDTSSNQLVDNIPVTAPTGLLPNPISEFKGNNTNSVTVSQDGRSLYVSNGWMNEVAVVQLGGPPPIGGPELVGGPGPNKSQVIGLIPTGWYPNSVSFSQDGKFVYVVNDKSPTGPNPGYCHVGDTPTSTQCGASNQYDLQLIKAGLQSFPTPTPGELWSLTQQVANNNHFGSQLSVAGDSMAFLRSHIHHIIYIIKENRTYDQILGDLSEGNGDPSLTEFGSAVTPNLHQLASQFVDLDNFYDTSEVSMDGWPWSTAAHALDVVERQTSVEYAGRGLSYDSEGTNRNVNVSYLTLGQRLAANPLTPNDPNVLPGTTNIAAPDGPEGQFGAGFLWDAALRAGLTVRNYGFFIDEALYNVQVPPGIPEIENPFASNTTVAYSTSQSLRCYTDQYFRGFDMTIPDYWRFEEWQRDFTANGLMNLTLLRLPHDHTGNYSIALAGVNTPDLDEADNDYAVGLVVQTIANSSYKDDTLIFSIEDDAQDGGDHVDAHRSIAFVVGPYVKQGAVVSTSYTTLSMFRTIEDILGIGHQNLNDALALPMADVFDTRQKEWTFSATPSGLLCADTQLDLPPAACEGVALLYPRHNAAYWAQVTKGMDFSREDHVDGQQFNRILWKGLMGEKPYPETPSGLDLRANRQQLLERYRANLQQLSDPPVESPASSVGGGK
jgi:YVTN family beta-propeller protein